MPTEFQRRKNNKKKNKARTIAASLSTDGSVDCGRKTSSNINCDVVLAPSTTANNRTTKKITSYSGGDNDRKKSSNGCDDTSIITKGTTTTTTETAQLQPMACTHGSAAEHFAKGSFYQNVIDEWISKGDDAAEMVTLLSIYENMMKGPEFAKHAFASATDIFVKNYGSEEYSSSKQMSHVRNILLVGLTSKYDFSPLSIDSEKYEKYYRDILTERGMINVLFRETSPFCRCMEPFKLEAKSMEKVGVCRSCLKDFPKMDLRRCSRCLNIAYCSNKCMKDNWSNHKEYCNKNVQINSEE